MVVGWSEEKSEISDLISFVLQISLALVSKVLPLLLQTFDLVFTGAQLGLEQVNVDNFWKPAVRRPRKTTTASRTRRRVLKTVDQGRLQRLDFSLQRVDSFLVAGGEEWDQGEGNAFEGACLVHVEYVGVGLLERLRDEGGRTLVVRAAPAVLFSSLFNNWKKEKERNEDRSNSNLAT